MTYHIKLYLFFLWVLFPAFVHGSPDTQRLLDELGTEMHDHFSIYMKESINENKSGLERIKFHFDKLFGPDLKFNINRDPNNLSK